MIYIHKCLRCNHEWASKNFHPIRCAQCKTPYWDKQKHNSEVSNTSIDSFWERVNRKEADDCWEWQGHIKKNGYGQIMIRSRSYPAHRLSWIINKGEIPSGKLVLHTCDNPKCVNPSHLYLGTYSDNMRDMWERERHSLVNQSGENNNFSRLTTPKVREIKTYLKNNAYRGINRQLAKSYGVHEATISYIKHNKIWKTVEV